MVERALDSGTWIRLAAVGFAGLVGLLVGMSPGLAILLVTGLIGAGFILVVGSRVTPLFLGSLAVILAGYALFNRSFAYIGAGPLFVGEAVLGLGGLAWLHASRRWQLTPVHVLLLLFMAWGAARTIPYLPEHGTDALRDAVGWSYGLYALFLSAIVLPGHFPAIVRLVRRVLPLYVLWVPIAALTAAAFGDRLPRVFGGVSILTFKGGDAGVLLGAAAAFILLGLYSWGSSRPRLPEPLIWIPWLAAAGVVAVLNRGGMLAATTAGLAVLFVRQSSRWLSVGFIVALIVVLGMLIDPRIDVGGRREFSFRQLTDNVGSLFSNTGSRLEGTKDFRLRWWGYIWSYTVDGPYFLTGKGYGIALAVDDGFDTTEAEELRSPHNGHIEVLARAGVPGFALWVLLQATFGSMMIASAWRAHAERRPFWVAVIGWLFVLWAAGMANATFDPYLQGPQGGIWFWSAMGLGMAAMRAAAGPREHDPPDVAPLSAGAA